MTTKEKITVQENMTKYGGKFVSSLGRALMVADSYNAEKIKKAFPEYWIKYLTFEENV